MSGFASSPLPTISCIDKVREIANDSILLNMKYQLVKP